MAKQKRCRYCEGEGTWEIYPPHSADAYDGTGSVFYPEVQCPICSGKGFFRHKIRKIKALVKRCT